MKSQKQLTQLPPNKGRDKISRNSSQSKEGSQKCLVTYKQVGRRTPREGSLSHCQRGLPEKPLVEKLHDRLGLLSQHVQRIEESNDHIEPYYVDFMHRYSGHLENNKVQLEKMRQAEQQKEKDQQNETLDAKHFTEISNDYKHLANELKQGTQTLTGKCRDLEQLVDGVFQSVAYTQENMCIQIKEAEIQIREFIISQSGDIDFQIEKVSKELSEQVLNTFSSRIEEQIFSNDEQIALLEECLHQMEQELGAQCQELERRSVQVEQKKKGKGKGKNCESSTSLALKEELDRLKPLIDQQLAEDFQNFFAYSLQSMEQEFVQAVSTMKEQFCKLKEHERTGSEFSLPQIRESDASSRPSTRKDVDEKERKYSLDDFQGKIDKAYQSIYRFEQYVISSSEEIGDQQEDVIARLQQNEEMQIEVLDFLEENLQNRLKFCQELQQSALSDLQEAMAHKDFLLEQCASQKDSIIKENWEAFNKIEVIGEHYEDLGKHVENTQQFLGAQLGQIGHHFQQ